MNRVLTALALTTSIAAQSAPSFFTETEVYAWSQFLQHSPSGQGARANRAITPSSPLGLNAGNSQYYSNVHASITTDPQFPHLGKAQLSVGAGGNSQANHWQRRAGTGNQWPFQPGAISFRLQFRDVPGRRAEIHLWATGQVQGAGTHRCHTQIDIGVDGNLEFDYWSNGQTERTLPITVPASGIVDIRLRYDCYSDWATMAAGFAWTSTTVEYRYPPQADCTITSYGTSCGPTLTATENRRSIERDFVLRMDGAPRLSLGAMAVGINRTDLPIPASSCSLLTDIGLTIPLFTDPTGRTVTHLPAISNYDLLTLTMQIVIVDWPTVRATNGIEIVCQ